MNPLLVYGGQEELLLQLVLSLIQQGLSTLNVPSVKSKGWKYDECALCDAHHL